GRPDGEADAETTDELLLLAREVGEGDFDFVAGGEGRGFGEGEDGGDGLDAPSADGPARESIAVDRGGDLAPRRGGGRGSGADRERGAVLFHDQLREVEIAVEAPRERASGEFGMRERLDPDRGEGKGRGGFQREAVGVVQRIRPA